MNDPTSAGMPPRTTDRAGGPRPAARGVPGTTRPAEFRGDQSTTVHAAARFESRLECVACLERQAHEAVTLAFRLSRESEKLAPHVPATAQDDTALKRVQTC